MTSAPNHPVFTDFVCDLKPEWIDYNNHLNDAAYANVLTEANELFLEHVHMSANYRETTGCSLYTVDMHISYTAEVHAGQQLQARTWITELAAKKIRVRTEIIRADDAVAATGTILYLHYDSNAKTVTPIPAEFLANLNQWVFSTNES